MTKEPAFFTSRMGERLRDLRRQAHLSQDEVADRMGLKGQWRKVSVSRLEKGRIGNPSLKLVAHFLRVCGARWSEFTDLLMWPEPVAVDAEPIEEAGFEDEIRDRVLSKTERQARKFQHKLAYPIKRQRGITRPVHPARQQAVVLRLRDYRMVSNIVEQDVTELFRKQAVPTPLIYAYKDVARETLGLLWRQAKTEPGRAALATGVPGEIAAELRRKAWLPERDCLDRKVVGRIQRRTIVRFRQLLGEHPELFTH